MPALGALAAEPLYLLADTAIVGHLGTRPLAGLAVAGSVLTAAFGDLQLPRLQHDRGGRPPARRRAPPRARPSSGVDGCWLAVGLGLVLTVLGLALAPPIVDVMGASADVAPLRGHVPAHQHPRRARAAARAGRRRLPARHAGHDAPRS